MWYIDNIILHTGIKII